MSELIATVKDMPAIIAFGAPTMIGAITGLLLIAYAGSIGAIAGMLLIAAALGALFLPNRWK